MSRFLKGWTRLILAYGLVTAGVTMTVIPAGAQTLDGFSQTVPMAEARSGHTATRLPDGRVLVAGGIRFSTEPLGSAEIFDPASGLWTPTSPLHEARGWHVAVLLNNGKVLVAGGRGEAGAIASAELYDPATGVWTFTGAMTQARVWHAASVLKNGEVVVSGGRSSTRAMEALKTTEVYNSTTGLWTESGYLNAARSGHTSTMVNDEVVVIGGSSQDFTGTIEVYQPNYREWVVAGSGSGGTPDRLRIWAAATLLPDFRVLVSGGSKTDALSTAGIYKGYGWTATGAMAAARSSHTATLLPDGRVLAVGGVGTGGAVLSGSETWSGSQWTASANLISARTQHTATVLPNGKVLIAGGYDSSGNLASCEIFTPKAGEWRDLASMNVGRMGHKATVLPSGKLLVAGGEGWGQKTLDSAEVYDPATDAWTNTGTFKPREAHTLTMLADGRVMVTGGYRSNFNPVVIGDTELYDPAANSWSVTGSMNTPRSLQAAVLLPDGKVLVAGGRLQNDFTGLKEAEIYDPATGVWTATNSMATAKPWPSATLLINGKVLVVSGRDVYDTQPGSAEIYDPATGFWTATGPLNSPHFLTNLVLLSDGRVLAAGSYQEGTKGTSEIYDPATNQWSSVSTMLSDEYARAATLLADGRVLVTGDEWGGPGEIYNPATNAWSSFTGPGSSGHQATLMPDGRIVFTGGLLMPVDPAQVRVRAWNPHFATDGAVRPSIVSAWFDATDRLVLAGSGFAGNAEGTPPVVTLRRLDNSRTLALTPSGPGDWSATSFLSQPLTDFPLGYAMVTLSVNGIQSTSVLVSRGTPEIAVEQPEGTPLAAGGVVDFGSPAWGQSSERSFTVRNFGRSDLTGLTLSLSGAGAGAFAILSNPPASLQGPAGTASFTVRFTGNVPGPISARLQVASNDADESRFQVLLTGIGVNSAPQITPPVDQILDEDTATGALALTVSDVETPEALVVTVNSSNPALIPVSGIVLAGSGPSRTVSLTPLPGMNGVAVITLTVSDGVLQASASFQLTVNAVNDPPTLGEIADPAVQRENDGPRSIALTGVGSGEGAAQSVAVTAVSDNPGLFIQLTATDSAVGWTTAPDASGKAVVTVTANDGQGAPNSTVSRSFTVRVLPTIRGEAAQIPEGNTGSGGVMPFRIFIHSPQSEAVSVEYTTDTTVGAGRAQAGSDYLAAGGKVVIPAGATEALVNIGIVGDTAYEPNEELGLLVSNPQNAFLPLGSSMVITGVIENDDAQPTLAVTDGSVTEAPSGGPFQVWVAATLSAPSPLPLTWTVATRSGTAVAGGDFTPLGPVALTFAPGETSKWIAVKLNAAAAGSGAGSEGDEEFYIDFNPGSGFGTAVTSTATIRQLAVREFYPLGTGLFALRFPTGKGQTYIIEEAASLAGPWAENSALILGSGSQVTQIVFSSKRKSFFRVRAASSPPGTADVGP